MQEGGSRLSEGGQQRLARLAAQQAAIQKGMQEGAPSRLDSRREVLGNLSDLSKQMEDTAEGTVQRGEVDDRLLSQQHQIMSRLLECAALGSGKRDLSKERLSRPGEEMPGAGGRDSGSAGRDALAPGATRSRHPARGRSDPYPPEFRELWSKAISGL